MVQAKITGGMASPKGLRTVLPWHVWRKRFHCPRLRSGLGTHDWKPRRFTWKCRVTKNGNWQNDCGSLFNATNHAASVVRRILLRRPTFAVIGAIPIVTGDLAGGVRRVLEKIMFRVGCAGFHGGHFGVDGDHRIAEAVEFVLEFAFGGVDHECADDRLRERGCMKTVIRTRVFKAWRLLLAND